MLPQGLKPRSIRSGYRSAEALRHPKSTAAGEGARATRNRVISLGLNGAAKSRAPSKQHQNPERSADVESRPLHKTPGAGYPAPKNQTQRHRTGVSALHKPWLLSLRPQTG